MLPGSSRLIWGRQNEPQIKKNNLITILSNSLVVKLFFLLSAAERCIYAKLIRASNPRACHLTNQNYNTTVQPITSRVGRGIPSHTGKTSLTGLWLTTSKSVDIRSILKKIHEAVSFEDSHEKEMESAGRGVTSNQRRSGSNRNITVIWKQLAEANLPANKLWLRWRSHGASEFIATVMDFTMATGRKKSFKGGSGLK